MTQEYYERMKRDPAKWAVKLEKNRRWYRTETGRAYKKEHNKRYGKDYRELCKANGLI